MPTRHPSPRYFLFTTLISIIILMIVIQCHTFEKIKQALAADPEISAINPGLGGKTTAILAATGPFDWILLSLVILSIMALIFLEWKIDGISSAIGDMLESDRSTLLLVAVLSALATRFYLAPGMFSLGDSSLHVYRAWGAARSFAEGHYPYWSFFNYGGYPFLQFYGPLFHLLVASTASVFGSIDWSAKTWLFIMHWASAFPIYYWARTIGAKRGGSVIAALAYVLSFLHTHTIIWTGALQMSGVFLAFPMVLLSIEKILAEKGAKWIPVLSISTACLVLFHQGYAASGLQLAVLYAIIRWAIPSHGTRPGARLVILAGAGMAAGILICSFFLWNTLFNKDGVYLPSELLLLRPGIPSREFLKTLLFWRNMWSGWTAAYLGLSLVMFAVFGYISAWKRNRSGEIDVLRHLSIVAFFAILCCANGGRTINLVLPFLSVSAFGAILLLRKQPPGKAVVILLAILFLDLGPTTIQSPYRSDHAFIREGMREISKKINPHRAIYGYSSGAGTYYYNWTDSRQTDLIMPTGFFPQGAPHSLNSITAMVDRLNDSGCVLTEDLSDALYLWDVSAILTNNRTMFISPELEGLATAEGDPAYGVVLPSSPLIFSEVLASANDDSLMVLQERELLQDRLGSESPARRQFARLSTVWIQNMKIDRSRGTAERLFVPRTAVTHQETSTDISGAELTIEDYRVEMYHVSIRYTSKTEGYLRAAFSWYPDLEVRLDGKPVDNQRSLLGAIILPTPAGDHLLELIPLRKTSVWSIALTLAGLLITVGLYLARRKMGQSI